MSEPCHVKQREKTLPRTCRFCRQAPCKSIAQGGVSCHAIYMRFWRLRKRIELERLREQERKRQMREIAERVDRERGPS